MKKIICLLAVLGGFTLSVHAQDEGTIVKRERIDRKHGIFFQFGPSLTLGKNIGDYSGGYNIELGYYKRVNRVLSIGPSISYMEFAYDPEVTSVEGGDAYLGLGDPNKWGEKYALNNYQYYYGFVLALEGGDLSLTSISVNLKFNVIPIMASTKLSVYGFVKPFITFASRGAVTGFEERYTYEVYEDDMGTSTDNDDLLYYNLGDGEFYPDGHSGNWGPETYEALKESNEVTGGIFVGPGIELFPNKRLSYNLQAAFGYTFPLTFVSTRSYESTVESYLDEEFPMIKKGFPSINIQLGLSYNF